jgi:hypothetical protein
MVERTGILILLLIFATNVWGQHLIGLHKDEVVKKMQQTSFVIDNSSRNTTFKYLKYVDKFEDKTFLVFLSPGDSCTSTKLMCDYSSLKSTVAEFNKNYKKVSSNVWNYKVNGITYKVELRKEEWFYSVIVTSKTK